MVPLRCVLLSGGNASGKTTLLRWGRARLEGVPGYKWYSEGGGGKSPCTMPVQQAYDYLLGEWQDPTLHTIVLEGTRVYNTVFRVAATGVPVQRALWPLVLAQEATTWRRHIRARCAARGKVYRVDWATRHGHHEAAQRYLRAHERYLPWLREQGAPVEPPLVLWVGGGYAELETARTWLARALRFKQFGRPGLTLPS